MTVEIETACTLPPTPSRSIPPQGGPNLANRRDVDLMTRVSQGDRDAFQALVETHQSAVIGTVAKMLGHPAEAEDIAQQVFLRVWKSAPRYEPTAQFNTWLFTITRNLVYNETRRRQRRPTVSVEERESESHQVIEDTQVTSPDDNALQSELEEAVDEAILALPERQRMVVILRRYQEMSYTEIGRIISASEPAVKSLLFRAREQLRTSLKPYLEG